MKIWNLSANAAAEGGKVVELHITGVIDGGWMDEHSVSTAEIIAALAEHQDAKVADVKINSMGGSLWGGIAVYNVLQAMGAKGTEVRTEVVGVAASAASIIAMAGKTRMGTGAMIMIHNPWTIAMGDASELRKAAAMLDKGRDALVQVYKAKTGKDAAELKAMLDAETWMGGEQALRQGFANEIAGEQAAPIVQDLGETVLFNSVQFPREAMPVQILAMAAPKTPPAPSNPTPPAPRAAAIQGSEAGQLLDAARITREVLAEKAPALLAALLEEGRKAGEDAARAAGILEGITAERERLQAIDELGLKGCDAMVTAAKYGEKPSDAAALAVAAIKAGKQASIELLEQRRIESAGAAGVRQTPPQQNSNQVAEDKAAKDIARYANERRT